MNFKNLSNDNLIHQFENSVRCERKITAQVLEYIAEIDRRKLYLDKNHTSLFDYLVKDFNYSPSAAVRRIDAARLLREIPEVAEKFGNGSITLSQANQIQRASREKKKNKSAYLQADIKRELIAQIQNTTQKQTEQILANTLDISFTPQQKEALHRDESVTLTITFTKEQMEILEQVQKIISHSVPNKNWPEVITYLAKKELTRRTNMPGAQRQQISAAKTHNSTTATVVDQIPFRKRKPIPLPLRKSLLNLNSHCEYKYQSGKKCRSQYFLQIDHIKSVSRGGTNQLDNLQVLCGVHNRMKYEREGNCDR